MIKSKIYNQVCEKWDKKQFQEKIVDYAKYGKKQMKAIVVSPQEYQQFWKYIGGKKDIPTCLWFRGIPVVKE